MMSAQLFGRRRRTLFPAFVLLAAVATAMAIAAPDGALAQAGAPGPGWVQLPGGGWVPPDHPLATGVAPPSGVPADPAICGLQTLRGSYVFAASGYNIVAGVQQPKAIVEAVEFHGDGTLSVPAATVSINGNVMQSSSGIGVYSLDNACRGTLTFIPGPSFDIFADASGRLAWMIQTNPGTVFQGTLTKLSR